MSSLSNLTFKKVFQPVSPDISSATWVPGILTYNGSAPPNPYDFYLNILSQWPTAPAMMDLWMVMIDLQSVSALTNDPSFLVNSMESTGAGQWAVAQNTVDKLTSEEYQRSYNNLIGCVFAQDIIIPGESVAVTQSGLDYAGLRSPNTAGVRAKSEMVTIKFLETNASFLDLIIRPWIILVSHFGLVARASGSTRNVKSNYMDVIQYAKTGPLSTMAPRKIIRYFNVVPTKLSGYSMSKHSSGLARIDVSFAYDSYVVLESGTSSYIS